MIQQKYFASFDTLKKEGWIYAGKVDKDSVSFISQYIYFGRNSGMKMVKQMNGRDTVFAFVNRSSYMRKSPPDRDEKGKYNKGNIYYFCYDYGYLPLEHDWYLVVKNSKQQ